MPTPPKTSEFDWSNPLFKDVPAFLARIETFVDMFGSAHVVLPKAKNQKFIDAINENGYKMDPLDATGNEHLSPAQMKKLKFYAISKKND